MATTYSYSASACDVDANCSPLSAVATVVMPDTQAPSVPTGLRAVVANVIAASPYPVVIVSGAVATDNVAVSAYRIYRDGIKVADANHYFDTAVQAGKSYSYSADACENTTGGNGYLTLETSQQARQFVANEGGPAEMLLIKADGTLLARGFNDANSLTPVNFSGGDMVLTRDGQPLIGGTFFQPVDQQRALQRHRHVQNQRHPSGADRRGGF